MVKYFPSMFGIRRFCRNFIEHFRKVAIICSFFFDVPEVDFNHSDYIIENINLQI